MYISLDMGGSKILGAVFNDNGEIIETKKMKTGAKKGREHVINIVREIIDNLLVDKEKLNGIGIIVPGIVKDGKIIFCTNVPLNGVDLASIIKEEYNCPCVLGNDVDLAVYGEYMSIENRPKSAVGIFIGTGVGGGIIIDGKLYTGKLGAAEVGHITIVNNGKKCNCGKRGCVESYAAKSGMLKTIENYRKHGRKSIIIDNLKKGEMLKTSLLKEAYDKGDKLAIKLIRKSIKATSILVGSLNNILNPDIFIFGGGIIEDFREEYLDKVEKKCKNYSLDSLYKGLDLRISKLGDNAGIVGGYHMLKNEAK